MSPSTSRPSAPGNMPLGPTSYADLLQEYPELADDIKALTSVHDVGKYDRKSKDFEKLFPSMKPTLNGE